MRFDWLHRKPKAVVKRQLKGFPDHPLQSKLTVCKVTGEPCAFQDCAVVLPDSTWLPKAVCTHCAYMHLADQLQIMLCQSGNKKEEEGEE